MMKTYRELIRFETFDERLEYLMLDGRIGVETFGYDRYINQNFYRSAEWKKIRDQIIVRDNGCDLGLEGYSIKGRILIHHMNPISLNDIINNTDILLNPDYMICVSHLTHNAIHYGNSNILKNSLPIERTPNDMIPWR